MGTEAISHKAASPVSGLELSNPVAAPQTCLGSKALWGRFPVTAWSSAWAIVSTFPISACRAFPIVPPLQQPTLAQDALRTVTIGLPHIHDHAIKRRLPDNPKVPRSSITTALPLTCNHIVRAKLMKGVRWGHWCRYCRWGGRLYFHGCQKRSGMDRPAA